MNTCSCSTVDLTANPARKTLLLDLDSIVDRLPPDLARLENFEALAFGPMRQQRAHADRRLRR